MIGGQTLPLCARCTGVFAGAALMAFALPLARFKPSQTILWLHGLAILQMLFLGFHLVGEQAAWVRTLSGTLFAIGTMYFLWLPVGSVLPPRADARAWPYFVAVGAITVALQVLVRLDVKSVASLVLSLALLGIVTFAAVALAAVISCGRALSLRGTPA